MHVDKTNKEMLEKHLLQFFKICGTLVKRELFSFLKKPELYLQRLLS